MKEVKCCSCWCEICWSPGTLACFTEPVHFSPRLLIAINRRDGPAVAKQTVKLAEEFLLSTDGVVVGLDLSGDPNVSFCFALICP